MSKKRIAHVKRNGQMLTKAAVEVEEIHDINATALYPYAYAAGRKVWSQAKPLIKVKRRRCALLVPAEDVSYMVDSLLDKGYVCAPGKHASLFV